MPPARALAWYECVICVILMPFFFVAECFRWCSSPCHRAASYEELGEEPSDVEASGAAPPQKQEPSDVDARGAAPLQKQAGAAAITTPSTTEKDAVTTGTAPPYEEFFQHLGDDEQSENTSLCT